MNGLAVDAFMTPHPYTVGKDQSMSTAHRIMREHNIRHLPVLESGKVVGVVTERDLHLMETLKDVNPDEVLVEDAMSTDPYNVQPGTALQHVAEEMGTHKYGCAIVMREGRVEGVFTTVDACRALAQLLASQEAGAPLTAKKAPKKAVAKKKAPAHKSAPARKAVPARRQAKKTAPKRTRR